MFDAEKGLVQGVVTVYCFFHIFVHASSFYSALSEANQKATKKVMEAVISDHGGSERCPWSAAEMKGIHIN